jgi:hypothetical protein
MPEMTPLTCEELVELDEYSRKVLGSLVKIMNDNRGCFTPAEEFILDLVNQHADWRKMTPDIVEEELKTFRENFDEQVEIAREMVLKYPAHVLGGENCGDFRAQIEKLGQTGRDIRQRADMIRTAREAIRDFPALVMAEFELDELPEPWGSILRATAPKG